MKRLIALVVTVLMAAMLLVAPASAQSEATDPPVVPSLIDALRMLGTTAGAGMVLSFLLTRVAWFKALTGERRFWVVLALSMAVPMAATLALEFIPQTVLIGLEKYWQAISAGFILFIGSQVQYALNKPAN